MVKGNAKGLFKLRKMNKIIVGLKSLLLIQVALVLSSCTIFTDSDSLVDSKYDEAWNYYNIFQTATGFHTGEEYNDLKKGKYDQSELRLKLVEKENLNVEIVNNCHDLSYLTITEIKDPSIINKLKFENFPELRKFCITDNLLTNKILLELCKCTKLRYLVIIGSAEPIKIPAEIGNLKNLQGLHIYSAIFKSVAAEFAEVAPSELSLRGCALNNQEDKILGGSKVKFLELFFSPIRKLPESVRKMSSLEVFFLWNTGVENADALSSCSNLISLQMSGLELTNLPSMESTKLVSLFISNMKVNSIPDLPETCKLLVIEKSEIGNFDIRLKDSSNFKRLCVLESQLEFIPESWRNLKNLKTLYVRNSGLKALPDWIGEMSIESLDLKGHQLESLPLNFHNLPLKYFGLGSLTKVANWEEVFMIKSEVVCCDFTSRSTTEEERQYYKSNPEKFPLYPKLRRCAAGCYSPIIPKIFQK